MSYINKHTAIQNFIKEAICSLNLDIHKREKDKERLDSRSSEWQLLKNEIEVLRKVIDFSEEHLQRLIFYREKGNYTMEQFQKIIFMH